MSERGRAAFSLKGFSKESSIEASSGRVEGKSPGRRIREGKHLLAET